MIKHIFKLFILLIISLSCQNNEDENLKRKVELLTMENNILKDSITKIEDNYILYSTLTGIPDRMMFKVNDTGNVRFGFLKYGKIRNYNVYQKMNDTGERKLLFSDVTNATFDYKFCPKSIDDNEIEIITVFDIQGLSNEVYTILEFPVAE